MRTFLIGKDNRFDNFTRSHARHKVQFIAQSAFVDSLVGTKQDALWIFKNGEFLKAAIEAQDERIFQNQILLKKHARIFLLEEISADYFAALASLFKDIIALREHCALPIKDLFQVMQHKNPENYVIGGRVDRSTRTLTLIRGNLSRLVVPLLAFATTGEGPSPDFSKFVVEDFGQTLKFGEYEASVESVLYEFDRDHRRKRRSEFAKKDKTFGACLRRLRLQKGLRQTDFPQIDAREIRRIEQGEVTPRKSTIQHIADRLDVSPDDIVTF